MDAGAGREMGGYRDVKKDMNTASFPRRWDGTYACLATQTGALKLSLDAALNRISQARAPSEQLRSRSESATSLGVGGGPDVAVAKAAFGRRNLRLESLY